VLFAFLWLSQIAGATLSGRSPQTLIDAGWPTSPLYVLDLAFVLPLTLLAAVRLAQDRAGGLRIAAPLLVFIPLLAAGILVMTIAAVCDGQRVDTFQVGLFAAMTAIATALGVGTLRHDRAGVSGRVAESLG